MKDTRDMRDPEKLGRLLLQARNVLGRRGPSILVFADRINERNIVPNYKDEDTIAKYGRPQDLPEG